MKRRILGWSIVGAVLFGLVGASIATDASSFCNTCHEMRPYYAAWQVGAHGVNAECIECHVDAGVLKRLSHKPAALMEVVAHFSGDIAFPQPEPPTMPNARCLMCHDAPIDTEDAGIFSHADHEERAECGQCHMRTGHDVSAAALTDAGIYDADAAEARALSIQGDLVAAPGAGVANVPDHLAVGCSGCHDMAATGCLACHTVQVPDEHPEGADCTVCHAGFVDWVFAHPILETCSDCHDTPGDTTHERETECVICHVTPDSWVFEHPDGTSPCSGCHTRPADDHPERDDCATCHSLTGAWAHDI